MTERESNTNPRISVLEEEKEFSIKKPNSEPVDWHRADIKAALEKQGYSLAKLSKEAGYSPTAAGRALRTPWPAMEQVIARALGELPQAIWPSRYDASGIPLAYLPRTQRSKS